MSYQEYRPSRFQVLPPVVKNLLIINALFFLATFTFANAFDLDLTDILGLHYFGSEKFHPHQIITYMFMHGGFEHILLNMFALWMFGNVLENYWGPKRFLIYYIICGIGAALTHYTIFFFEAQPVLAKLNNYVASADFKDFENLFASLPHFRFSGELKNLVDSYNISVENGNIAEATRYSAELIQQYKIDYLNEPVVIGASGAVFGILLAFGMMFPNTMLYIYFAIPIKAKYFVIIYGAIELFSGITNGGNSNVAHFAHLGGMLFGFVMIKLWKKNSNLFM